MRHDWPSELRLHAYVDAELDERTHRAFEAHLAQCPRCQAKVAIVRSLKRAVAGLARMVILPPGLEDRVRRGVGRVVYRQLAARLAWPAGGLLAAAAVVGFFMVQAAGVNAVVSDHTRWLAGRQVSAIASAEPVVLRSWLSTRVEILPPVLARAGSCGAVGARVGLIGRRQASAVTYQCGTHVVDFYAMPNDRRSADSAAVAPRLIAAGAVNVVGWKRGRLDCYAVSDLPKSQLVEVAQYIQDHALEG